MQNFQVTLNFIAEAKKIYVSVWGYMLKKIE